MKLLLCSPKTLAGARAFLTFPHPSLCPSSLQGKLGWSNQAVDTPAHSLACPLLCCRDLLRPRSLFSSAPTLHPGALPRPSQMSVSRLAHLIPPKIAVPSALSASSGAGRMTTVIDFYSKVSLGATLLSLLGPVTVPRLTIVLFH